LLVSGIALGKGRVALSSEDAAPCFMSVSRCRPSDFSLQYAIGDLPLRALAGVRDPSSEVHSPFYSHGSVVSSGVCLRTPLLRRDGKDWGDPTGTILRREQRDA
jgi:hypothetical protein